MSSRTSTRQAAASSPPRNQQAVRTRNMRSRSASVDLGATTQGRRSTRQGSAGSVASNASMSKGKVKGKGKAKGIKASGPDMSVLNEEPEEEPVEESEPGSDDIGEFQNYDFDDLDSLRDDSSQIAGSKESQLRSDEFKENARKLMQTRKAAEKGAPIEKETTSSSRPARTGPSPIPAQASSSRNNEGDVVPGATTADILNTWQRSTRENNKENTKPAPKAQPTRREQKRAFVPDEDEEEDEESFQTDTRTAPIRAARPAPARPTKRPRAEASDPPDQPRPRREEPVQAEPEPEPELEEEEEEEEEEEAPTEIPQSTMVRAVAKANVQKAGLATRQTQTRQRWSEHDEALLIRLIGEHGCSWASLVSLGIEGEDVWEVERPHFAVQLKDKARNIKVAYLKSGTPLPVNFDQVKLGKKEVEAVKKVFPDYERED